MHLGVVRRTSLDTQMLSTCHPPQQGLQVLSGGRLASSVKKKFSFQFLILQLHSFSLVSALCNYWGKKRNDSSALTSECLDPALSADLCWLAGRGQGVLRAPGQCLA